MSQGWIDYTGDFLYRQIKKKPLVKWLCIAIIMAPLLFLSSFSSFKIYTDTTNFILSQKNYMSDMVSTMIKERLDKLVDLDTSLASRPMLIKHINDGNWNEAMAILEDVLGQFPFIDHIFLSDPKGTFMADMPATSTIIGHNFAFRDWHKGVSRDWEPYISEVYKRAIEPERAVIAVAVPVISGEDVIAILVLQILPETVLGWSKEMDVGLNAKIYALDKNGHIIFHPEINPENYMMDNKDRRMVEALKEKRQGAGIFNSLTGNTEEMMVYKTIDKYGWSIVITQPVKNAFGLRDESMKRILTVNIFAIIMSFLIAYQMLNSMIKNRIQGEELEKLNEDLKEQNAKLEALNAEMRKYEEDLERVVGERTEELSRTNEWLKREIANRVHFEEELKNRMADMERFNKVVVEREERMIELKSRIKELEARIGREKQGG